MRSCRELSPVLLLLFVFLGSEAVRAADKEKSKGGPVGGIIIGKNDKTMTVVIDGQEEVTSFKLPAGASPQMVKTWKSLYPAARVRLSYQMDGNDRVLSGLSKPPSLAKGTITGTVVKNYGWWVAVKPTSGPPDAYAFVYPAPTKAVKETMKSLEKGDTVAIQYYTDFERHRIIGMRKLSKAKPSKKEE